MVVACQNAGSDKSLQLTIGATTCFIEVAEMLWWCLLLWHSTVLVSPSNSSTERSWWTACCGASAVLRCKQAATRMSALAARWFWRFSRWIGHLRSNRMENGWWMHHDGSNLSITSYCKVIIILSFGISLDQAVEPDPYDSYDLKFTTASPAHLEAPGSYLITWKPYARASSCRAPPGAAEKKRYARWVLFRFLEHTFTFT